MHRRSIELSIKRVLVLSPWGLSGGYSGPLTLLDRLCTSLSRRGIEIDVAHRDRGIERRPDWVNKTFALGDIGPFNRKNQILWGIAARRLLRARADDYDLIHLHGFYLPNQLAMLGYRSSRPVTALPVLEGGDLGVPVDSRRRRHGKALGVRLALRHVDSALALSEGISDELEELGFAPDATALIGNPASTSSFEVGRERTAKHDPLVVGFVGKVGGFKNPALLLKAVAILREAGDDVRALFVGPIENDSTRADLENLVAKAGLTGSVEFTGYVENVADYLARMDVFVLPSSREGLPGALCEAMAAGLPCVVSDVGSMGAHVRAAEAGTVVDLQPSSIAEGIRGVTADRWHELSLASGRYARSHFSADAITNRYLQINQETVLA